MREYEKENCRKHLCTLSWCATLDLHDVVFQSKWKCLPGKRWLSGEKPTTFCSSISIGGRRTVRDLNTWTAIADMLPRWILNRERNYGSDELWVTLFYYNQRTGFSALLFWNPRLPSLILSMTNTTINNVVIITNDMKFLFVENHSYVVMFQLL